jgi:hypothetical protein
MQQVNTYKVSCEACHSVLFTFDVNGEIEETFHGNEIVWLNKSYPKIEVSSCSACSKHKANEAFKAGSPKELQKRTLTGQSMPSCAVCGDTITEKEMEKNILGNIMGDLLGANAKYMPNLTQGLAMKCNRCGIWICIRCAENAAMNAGAGMIQHSDCGGMFESA